MEPASSQNKKSENQKHKAKREAEKAEREAFLVRKRRLFEFEQTNFDRIIIILATKGYYCMYGHSAVMFINKIAPELRIRAVLRRDSDFEAKFQEGVVSFKNIDFYKDKLLGSVYLKKISETKEEIVFGFKQKISKAEYNLLVKSREIKRQSIEQKIQKSLPLPNLNNKLSEVLRTSFRFYRKHSDLFSRKFVLDKMIDEIRIAHKKLILVCRDELPLKKGLLEIKQALVYSLCDLAQVVELEIWSVEDSGVLAEQIINTLSLVELEIKKSENGNSDFEGKAKIGSKR
ncbi:hypothetical protein IKF81_02125 [Candidatus Saccharibacteria bacterium]|nr:hypothetical protein [Candidatus Saccharibacteria bacterium]